jgi:hypothetical protein
MNPSNLALILNAILPSYKFFIYNYIRMTATAVFPEQSLTGVQKGIKIKIHPALRCCPTGVEELSGCSSMTLTVVKQSNKRRFCTNAVTQ